MGYWKNKEAEMTEGGLNLWDVEHKAVCAACFEDEALKAFVFASAGESECTYCGSEAPAAPMTIVVRHLLSCIEMEWTNADGALPRDDETDEWILGDPVSTEGVLLQELWLSEVAREDLLSDLVGALPDYDWCPRDPLVPTRDEAISNSWRAFCKTIKHERRYLFVQYDNHRLKDQIEHQEAEFTIPELLEELSRYAARRGLFVHVPAGSEYIRAQPKPPQTAPFPPRRLGPPPSECARQPNRISPAGVPMFYGAEHERTALTEIANEGGFFALGWFALARDVQLSISVE